MICREEGNGGGYYLTLSAPAFMYERLSKLKGAELEVNIEKYSEGRSLDANAALWKLVNEMAKKLGTSSNEIYLQMLERYGVFEFVCVKKKAVERFQKIYRLSKEVSEVSINGQEAVQLQCFVGSSKYNRREFARLLDGVSSEAAELGIYLFSADERQKILWRVKE
jgi:hypothetical protein